VPAVVSQVAVVHALLVVQSASAVQHPATGVCAHSCVVVSHASVVQALPSAQSALPRQHPVMREWPHVWVVRLHESAVQTLLSVQSVSETQHAVAPPSAEGSVCVQVSVLVLQASVVQKLLSLHWMFVVQRPAVGVWTHWFVVVLHVSVVHELLSLH